jgi:hypothetical protein
VVCGRRSFRFKAKIDKVRPQNVYTYLDKIIMSARCAAPSPGSGCSCHLKVIMMRAFSVLISFARSSVECPKVQVFFAAAPCFLASKYDQTCSEIYTINALSPCGLGYRKDALSSCGLGYRKDALSSCGLGYRKDALSYCGLVTVGVLKGRSELLWLGVSKGRSEHII